MEGLSSPLSQAWKIICYSCSLGDAGKLMRVCRKLLEWIDNEEHWKYRAAEPFHCLPSLGVIPSWKAFVVAMDKYPSFDVSSCPRDIKLVNDNCVVRTDEMTKAIPLRRAIEEKMDFEAWQQYNENARKDNQAHGITAKVPVHRVTWECVLHDVSGGVSIGACKRDKQMNFANCSPGTGGSYVYSSIGKESVMSMNGVLISHADGNWAWPSFNVGDRVAVCIESEWRMITFWLNAVYVASFQYSANFPLYPCVLFGAPNGSVSWGAPKEALSYPDYDSFTGSRCS